MGDYPTAVPAHGQACWGDKCRVSQLRVFEPPGAGSTPWPWLDRASLEEPPQEVLQRHSRGCQAGRWGSPDSGEGRKAGSGAGAEDLPWPILASSSSSSSFFFFFFFFFFFLSSSCIKSNSPSSSIYASDSGTSVFQCAVLPATLPHSPGRCYYPHAIANQFRHATPREAAEAVR